MASNSVNPDQKPGSKSAVWWIVALIILAIIVWRYVAGRTP
ncbi:MAG: hypothetical protein JWM68_5009 [Verrucomicrobiales bacterium]|nr:hypothetical protein [Verrucomicrobiales bacterium]